MCNTTPPTPLEQAQARIVELERELDAANAAHLDTIIERDALKQENQLLRAENVNLSMAHGPGNHTDWMLTRASKYEQLHKDLEKMRQERDALLAVAEKADALVKQMLPECEACGTPCESYMLARMYQEAHHG